MLIVNRLAAFLRNLKQALEISVSRIEMIVLWSQSNWWENLTARENIDLYIYFLKLTEQYHGLLVEKRCFALFSKKLTQETHKCLS